MFMNYRSFFSPVLGMVALLLIGCVEEYTLDTNSTTESDIVIQGRILSGDKSIIYVTRTQPLNSKESTESILNAQITIIGQNGYKSELAEFNIEKDCYIIDTEDLQDNTLTHYK